jgi:hypothetical protein
MPFIGNSIKVVRMSDIFIIASRKQVD